MSTRTDRPWLALYDDGAPREIELEHASALAMVARAVERAADRPGIRYFDSELTWADIDRMSDALAAGLRDLGIAAGDRVAVYLQNVPQFVVAMVATWKKGAMNTHANVVFNAQVYRDWIRLGEDDSVFGAAPLFHITGLIGHVAIAMLVPMPLVLFHRFEPGLALEQAERHKPTYTIAAITAFIALLNHPDSRTRDLSSLKTVYSGGV